jgi:hypothetical protein
MPNDAEKTKPPAVTRSRFQDAFDAAIKTGKLITYNPQYTLSCTELEEEILPFLKENLTITWLSMGGSNIGEEGRKALLEALPDTKIHVLDGLHPELTEAYEILTNNFCRLYDHECIVRQSIQEAFSNSTISSIPGVLNILYGYACTTRSHTTYPQKNQSAKKRKNSTIDNATSLTVNHTTPDKDNGSSKRKFTLFS